MAASRQHKTAGDDVEGDEKPAKKNISEIKNKEKRAYRIICLHKSNILAGMELWKDLKHQKKVIRIISHFRLLRIARKQRQRTEKSVNVIGKL
jgi:hypothetical protein